MVEDEEIGRALAREHESVLAVAGSDDLVPVAAEPEGDEREDVRVVVGGGRKRILVQPELVDVPDDVPGRVQGETGG
jgi:hypothetical protein